MKQIGNKVHCRRRRLIPSTIIIIIIETEEEGALGTTHTVRIGQNLIIQESIVEEDCVWPL